MLCNEKNNQAYGQVTWAKRFPQLQRLDLSAASYDTFDALFHGDMYWPDSGSDQEIDSEDTPIPETVTQLAWGSPRSDDLITAPSGQPQAPGLEHCDRRWHVINAFANRLPDCLSVTSLEITGAHNLVLHQNKCPHHKLFRQSHTESSACHVSAILAISSMRYAAGQAETYALCSHAMAAPGQWTQFLTRLHHLRLASNSNTTAAAAVCLCLAANLTSVHISGSPGRQALSALPAAIPYISPDTPAPRQSASASQQHRTPQETGVILVPVHALQLIASAALQAKQLLPCAFQPCQPASAHADPSTTPSSTQAVPVRYHAIILPQLRSLTTDASQITCAASVGVLEQHPPSDLLTRLPNTLPQPQHDQREASASHTLCLSSVAAAAAARALILPATPPSAPAWLAVHPALTRLHAPNATLPTGMPALSHLTSLCLKRISQSAAGPQPRAATAGPLLHSLSFPLPLNLRAGLPRALPSPGVCAHLTQLHLAPPERTSLPFSTLARLVLDCPVLEDLEVSRCLTAPPSAVIAPRAAAPVHFFLHTPTDVEAEGSLMEGSGPRRPAPLRRFVCDNAPGCLYLLPVLDAARPVRGLEEVSLNNNLCLPGRLLALLAEQRQLQQLHLLGSSRAVSPPQVCSRF